jgi:hypothetical protein
LEDVKLLDCWKANPNGAGFMYSKEGRLVIEKGFMKWKHFIKAYHKALKNGADDSNLCIHFRIMTHGAISPANTHPFGISKRLGVAHNGIVNWAETKKDEDKTLSDTALLVRDYFQKLPVGFLENDAIRGLIAQSTSGSHFIFMSNTGEVDYIGAGGYFENDDKKSGVWYSNQSYKYASYRTAYGANGYGSLYDFDDMDIGAEGTSDFKFRDAKESDVAWDKWRNRTAAQGLTDDRRLTDGDSTGYGQGKVDKCDECGATLYTLRDHDLGLCYKCAEAFIKDCATAKKENAAIDDSAI